MPKAEYEEYLRQSGASAEDIKALAEGSFAASAIKAFDRSQAALAEAEIARKKAEEKGAEYDTWFQQELSPKWQEVQTNAVKAETEAARLRTALVEAHKRGIIDVTKDLGFKPDELGLDGTPPARRDATPNNPPTGFDPNAYLTKDQILAIAKQEGDAIALAQDVAYEHALLFPDKPANFRALLAEARTAKKSVEEIWMQKFNVAGARAERERKAQEARDAKIRQEERQKVEMEFASRMGNPDMRTLVPSRHPFTPKDRVGTDGAPKQPWAAGGDDLLSNQRVERAVKKEIERGVSH